MSIDQETEAQFKNDLLLYGSAWLNMTQAGVERIDPRSVWVDGKVPFTPIQQPEPNPNPELVDVRRAIMNKLRAEGE